MRDKVRILSVAMQFLSAYSYLLVALFSAFYSRSWTGMSIFGVGCLVGGVYFYAADCVTNFRRREFVRFIIAGSIVLSCVVFLLPLTLPLALIGTWYMRAYDVRWTFAQVAKGVPLKEVLATKPPRERFGDERDDFDDER